MASLSQLKSMDRGKGTDLQPLEAGREVPTDEDLLLLRRWVNDMYLRPETWAKVAETFRAENSVQLQDFLLPEVAAEVVVALEAADEREGLGRGRIPGYRAGSGPEGEGVAGGRWEMVGPPHMQRYLRFERGTERGGGGIGALLSRIREELFHSGACARLLGALTDLEATAIRSEVMNEPPLGSHELPASSSPLISVEKTASMAYSHLQGATHS